MTRRLALNDFNINFMVCFGETTKKIFRAIKTEILRHGKKKKNSKMLILIRLQTTKQGRKKRESRHMKMKATSKNSVRDYHKKERKKFVNVSKLQKKEISFF